jgi:hypothetical protein
MSPRSTHSFDTSRALNRIGVDTRKTLSTATSQGFEAIAFDQLLASSLEYVDALVRHSLENAKMRGADTVRRENVDEASKYLFKRVRNTREKLAGTLGGSCLGASVSMLLREIHAKTEHMSTLAFCFIFVLGTIGVGLTVYHHRG